MACNFFLPLYRIECELLDHPCGPGTRCGKRRCIPEGAEECEDGGFCLNPGDCANANVVQAKNGTTCFPYVEDKLEETKKKND
jgi:hypothetical protein